MIHSVINFCDKMSSNRKILGTKEIYIIMDIWKEHINELRGVHRNSHVYQTMCKQLQNQYGIHLQPSELRTRLNNLTKKYRAERAKTCKSGSSPSQWQYYEEINSIIGAYNSINYKEQMDESTENWFTDSRDMLIEKNLIVEISEVESSQSCDSSATPPTSISAALSSDNIPGPSSAKKEKQIQILWKDQEMMQHFLKQSLENDKKTISLLEENNKLLAEILKK